MQDYSHQIEQTNQMNEDSQPIDPNSQSGCIGHGSNHRQTPDPISRVPTIASPKNPNTLSLLGSTFQDLDTPAHLGSGFDANYFHSVEWTLPNLAPNQGLNVGPIYNNNNSFVGIQTAGSILDFSTPSVFGNGSGFENQVGFDGLIYLQPALVEQGFENQIGVDNLVYPSPAPVVDYGHGLGFGSPMMEPVYGNPNMMQQPLFMPNHQQPSMNTNPHIYQPFIYNPPPNSAPLLIQPSVNPAPSPNPTTAPQPCAHPTCTRTFTRDFERIRHEASVHGINLVLYYCHIAGCVKHVATPGVIGFKRPDRLTAHMWKKHADLGFVKMVR